MSPDDLDTVLRRAGNRRQGATPPVGDVTASVFDQIRRRATRREETAVWRWATSVAVAVAIVGFTVAASAWERLDNPLSDLASYVPAVQP